MALTGEQALGAALKKVKGCASGYDHYEQLDDTSMNVYFTNGDMITVRFPAPKDGLSIVDVYINADGHLECKMSDGSKIDAGELPGGGVLTEALTATVEIGSVSKGKTYDVGTKLEQIIRDMLIQELAPTVELKFNPNQTLYDVVTDELDSVIMVATVTNGTYPPKTLSWYVDGVKFHEQEIGAGRAVVTTYDYTYTPATPLKKNTEFKAVVTDGKLSSQSVKTIKFVGQSYYGIIDSEIGTPTDVQIKALNKTPLKDVKGYAYKNITCDYNKVVYAYPADFGALSSIKDLENNINYTNSFTRTTVKVDEIDYYCYTLTEPTGADGVNITFA